MSDLSAVLFDLDGVIIDSLSLNRANLKDTLERFHAPIPTEAFLDSLLSRPTEDQVRAIAAGLPESTVGAMVDYAKKRSWEILSMTPLMPRAIDILRVLRPKYRIGLITSRRREMTEKFLELRRLGPLFETVVVREDVSRAKPDPEGIVKALAALGVKPEEAVYVGDADADVEAARSAGTVSVLILKHSVSMKPDYSVSDISELPPLLEKLAGGA